MLPSCCDQCISPGHIDQRHQPRIALNVVTSMCHGFCWELMLVVNITNQPALAHKKMHTDFIGSNIIIKSGMRCLVASMTHCISWTCFLLSKWLSPLAPIGSNMPHLSDSSSKRVTAELRTMAKSSRFQTSKRPGKDCDKLPGGPGWLKL